MVVAEIAPPELLQAVLCEHLADPSARVTDLHVEPIPTDGYSSNQVYCAHIAWDGRAAGDARSATWILKRWLPGGLGARLLGVDRPLEALA